MLKRSGQETSEEERTGYISEIESLTRFIEYTRYQFFSQVKKKLFYPFNFVALYFGLL